MIPLSIVVAVALSGQTPAKAVTADDYVGRWNIRITDATDTFVSAGIRIDKTDNGLSGGLVWRSGSYAPVKSVQVKDGMLRMVREETAGRQDVLEARLEGATLKGQFTNPAGRVYHFEGRRAPLLMSKKAPVWGKPVVMFDGKTLNLWHQRDPKAKNGWAVVDGDLAVVEPKGNSDLASDAAFQDMKLHLEFNVEPKSNSGVYLRGRYEVQILDNPDAKMALDTHGCGAIYSRLAPTVDATKPAGEWQTLDVEFVGRQVAVTLNGKAIVKGIVDGITGGALSPYEEEPGPLMLQGDHGKVRFRNIVVTPGR
jgi:3-keto-disaccharide hydrolase